MDVCAEGRHDGDEKGGAGLMDFSNVKRISIAAGDVKRIEINGVIVWSSYVNQVPISTDTDGGIYNGVGYKDNARLSSSGGVSGSAQAGSVVTGFIPYEYPKLVRIKGASWTGLSAADGHYYVNAYGADKSFLAGVAASDSFASTVVAYDAATGVTTFDFSKWSDTNATRKAFAKASFIRLNAKGSGADLIVTVDEEIVV